MIKVQKTILVILALALSGYAASPEAAVLEYVRAIRVQRGRAAYTVDVTISASLPALSKNGVLRAIKKHASEHFTYESMLFQGDGLIKNNVIARYLSAEVETQRPEEKLATEISPLNYKFTPKGQEMVADREALVYEVKPLRRRSGLFRGRIWVDRQTSLPLKEQGKLDKLPSVWVKEIVFTREYTLEKGYAVPLRITSEVKTRLIGKSFINVEFGNYRFDETTAPAVDSIAAANDNNTLLELPREK